MNKELQDWNSWLRYTAAQAEDDECVVCWVRGKPHPYKYRRFKTQSDNDVIREHMRPGVEHVGLFPGYLELMEWWSEQRVN